MRLTSIQPGDPTRTGAGLPSRGECTCSASRPWEACLPFAAAPRAPSLRAIPLCEKRCPLISWRRRRCPLISGGAFFCIWAPKHLHPDTPILATQMLSSVAALSPAGYTSPMALPQSQVKASMASLDQLKDLAKSQNPVVVSCRKQPPTARLCISHPGLLTLAPTRCSGLLGPAEPCRGRVLGADQRGDHRLAAPR